MCCRMQASYKTLFWDLFGYGEPEDTDIVIKHTAQNMSNSSSEGTQPQTHYFTEFVGYSLVALYYIVAVVVLLNMLIAMLATSFKAITVRL